MAKVHFTAAISELRNKLGGSVYARNRYGAYARNYAIPDQPNTVYQTDMRALFGAVSSYWAIITEDEREQWRQAATRVVRYDIFSNSGYLTGLQYFNKINIELMLVTDELITTPPALRSTPLFSGLELSLNIVGLDFSVDLANNLLTSEYAMVIRATPAQSQGATFFKNLYSIVDIVDDASTLPQNIFVNYISKFIGFDSASRVGVQVYSVDKTTGLRSAPINGYIDVT